MSDQIKPHVQVNKIYTMSRSKHTGDRSYLEQCWRCVKRCGPKVLMSPVTKGFWDASALIMFDLTERDFYETSEDFVNLLSPANFTGYGV